MVIEAAENSRRKLGTEMLDAWLFHDASYLYDEDALAALDSVRQRGIARKVGVSVYTPDDAMKALDIPIIQVIQIPYNILDRRLDKCGFFDRASKQEVEVYTRSTLLQGLLMMDPEKLGDDMEFTKKYLVKFRDICNKYPVNLLDAAIGYVKAHRGIDYIVFGVDNIVQLEEYINATHTELPEEMKQELTTEFMDVEERVVNPTLWSHEK